MDDSEMNQHRAIFMDRDGIINQLALDPSTGELEGPLAISDVMLIPGATESIKSFQNAGFLVVGVTNQPAAAKGTISISEQNAIHERVIQLLAENEILLTRWQVCPHHPDGVVLELRTSCDCRKPKPGMLLTAADDLAIDLRHSWMIGDSDSDIEAGAAAGTKTALVGPSNLHKRLHPERATFHAQTLEIATRHVLAESVV